MDIEDKLKYFMDSSIETAINQSEQIIKEYKDSLDSLLENEKVEAYKQAKQREEIEKDNYKKIAYRTFSKQSLEIKRLISLKQKDLTSKVFEEVGLLLDRYKQTNEYFNLLLKQIEKAIIFSKGEEINIYIDPCDKHLYDKLVSESGQPLSLSKYSFKGGTRAVIPSKNILIDNSFESKILEAKEHFNISF